MDRKIKVAMIMGKMTGGGVESIIMNYYRHINKRHFQFDFIVDNDSTNVPINEIKKLGGKVIFVSPYQKFLKNWVELKYIFNKNKYYIVHSNINSLSVFPLRIAKKCGVPIRIAHNHSTSSRGEGIKNIIKNFLRIFSNIYPTDYMSPTYSAGKWLFGKKIADNNLYIMKDAIDIDKFKFNIDKRLKKRSCLGYSNDDLIIGNVGRLVWQKNQEFLLEVFYKLHQCNNNYKLIIIGDGPLKESLEDKCSRLGIMDFVKFIRNTSNIEDYYQIMDLLLFPSHYEGLGMVAVEAQISGLPVVLSTKVPNEVSISHNSSFLKLNDPITKWVETINRDFDFIDSRRSYIHEAKINGYDINFETKKLEKKYKSLLED